MIALTFLTETSGNKSKYVPTRGVTRLVPQRGVHERSERAAPERVHRTFGTVRCRRSWQHSLCRALLN